jgi:hypothetical protein
MASGEVVSNSFWNVGVEVEVLVLFWPLITGDSGNGTLVGVGVGVGALSWLGGCWLTTPPPPPLIVGDPFNMGDLRPNMVLTVWLTLWNVRGTSGGLGNDARSLSVEVVVAISVTIGLLDWLLARQSSEDVADTSPPPTSLLGVPQTNNRLNNFLPGVVRVVFREEGVVLVGELPVPLSATILFVSSS